MNDTRAVQFQLSPLLLASLIGGVASTVAVAIFAVLSHSPRLGPPPSGTLPPPPPSLTGLIISVGACVLAWAAVLITLARDQLMRRLAQLRAEVAAIEEYGERRETEGYLRAMRSAGLGQPGGAQVRALHQVPPPAD